SVFLRSCRLSLWALLSAGLLGLCYLFYDNHQWWPSVTPERSHPTTWATPSVSQPWTLPTPAPCVANASVHNVSGFSQLPGHAKRLNRLLRLEQREHGDVLQWDFRDTFFNLTLKQVLFHAWLEERCPGVRFVFNGDDDVFVNTDNVVRFAAGTREQHLMVGQLIVNTGPIRRPGSKWGGILMSCPTALRIARASRDLDIFPIDDVYLGMCLERAGLLPASHPGVRNVGLWVPAQSDPFAP
ncbi:PREDICTED: UDP-GlcNAc:betaGal beta-1,3-N-acetylglucosaminyltransferase 3-like, partial [Merops nubicus]|uniref:UDP-GlcNAc:betaGal beta-1,3-N-acetylglucosaminyltransferase 3-like n=1 Tax=Merops nubicus TaxID=57421 RepID=UPI0004F041DA